MWKGECLVTDVVKWEADGDDPVLPNLRSEHFEWIELDVPADSWWEIVDDPQVADRGLHGWNYHSCAPSPEGEDRVVLTYFRPHNLPAVHKPYAVSRRRSARVTPPVSTAARCGGLGIR